MRIKIQCGCGTKYQFDIEPVHGRMPQPVQCPGCGADGTTDANQIIAREESSRPPAVSPAAPVPVAAPVRPTLRVTTTVRPAAAETVAEAAPAATAAPAAGYDQSGRSLLERTTFFVKERVGFLKLTDVYDILDPASGQTIGIAKEEPPTWAKWLRLIVNKHNLPTAINLYESESQPPVLSIKRGFTFVRSKIRIITGDRRDLGYLKSKLFSIGGGFYVFDQTDQQVAEVKGNWKGWDFRFLNKHGREIGTVSKKWAGLGRELFTSADNYVISLSDLSGASADASALLLAAGLSIDIVYKEKK